MITMIAIQQESLTHGETMKQNMKRKKKLTNDKFQMKIGNVSRKVWFLCVYMLNWCFVL